MMSIWKQFGAKYTLKKGIVVGSIYFPPNNSKSLRVFSEGQ